jgi:hypothetical protein
VRFMNREGSFDHRKHDNSLVLAWISTHRYLDNAAR